MSPIRSLVTRAPSHHVRRVLPLLLVAIGCDSGATRPGGPVSTHGQLVWRSTAASDHDIPVFDDSTIYLVASGHVVSAVDKAAGTLRWQTRLQTSVPQITSDGLALVAGRLIVGDMDLFGLDPATGQVKWRYFPSQGSYPGFSTLATDGTVVFTGSADGYVFAVDAATGNEIWTSHFGDDSTQVWCPQLVDGVVYAAYSRLSITGGGVGGVGGAVAVNAANGAILWKVPAPAFPGQLASHNDYPVAVTPTAVVVGAPGGIFAIDRQTGQLAWSMSNAALGQSVNAHKVLLRAGNRLAIANESPGDVTVIDLADRHTIWESKELGAVFGMSSDGTDLYATRLSVVDVYDFATGKKVWQISDEDFGTPDELYVSPPAFDGSRFYLGGSQAVYAFNRP